jgi:hypothetical protein
MARAISYDETVIGEFARRLYQRATTIIVLCALVGIIVGGLVGAAAARPAGGDGGGLIMFFVLIGGLIGFAIGRERAFMLKLQAQVALCQVQIERNTRTVAATVGYGPR